MAGWTFSRVWETVSRVRPEADAQIQGPRRTAWRAFERRAAGIAGSLRRAGLPVQGKVALYLENAPEFMEAAFGVLKARLVPVNTNYRYGEEELAGLWDDADVEAVVFHGSFAPMAGVLRTRRPGIRLWIHVEDGSHPCPEWAMPYETAAGAAPHPAGEGSGDDLILIYTGGTTGRPKGVMWRQHDLYMASNTTDDPPGSDMAHVEERLRVAARFPVGMSAAPLMHGTGFVFASTVLSRGGTLVTQTGAGFEPTSLLDDIDRHRVSDLCIVGDAFARPLVEALDAEPARWDLACLRAVSSSGMAWSAETKQRLLAHAPDALMIDFLNSSEASGMGRSIASRRGMGEERSDRFRLGRNAFVVDEDMKPMRPGDDRLGLLAVRGHVPLGYHKDPAKTAATFPVVDGVRCAIPGDHARLTEDGGIVLLGRGSTSINTGGEKVFAQEVEEVIKTCPGVRDALVLGVPDERLGQMVTALVEAAPGTEPAEAEVVAHVRARLAGYKAPRRVMIVEDLGRTITGKPDYPAARARLARWLETG